MTTSTRILFGLTAAVLVASLVLNVYYFTKSNSVNGRFESWITLNRGELPSTDSALGFLGVSKTDVYMETMIDGVDGLVDRFRDQQEETDTLRGEIRTLQQQNSALVEGNQLLRAQALAIQRALRDADRQLRAAQSRGFELGDFLEAISPFLFLLP